MRYVTLQWLRDQGACLYARELFLDVFQSTRVEITERNLRKAQKGGLDLGWLCSALLRTRSMALCNAYHEAYLTKERSDRARGEFCVRWILRLAAARARRWR